jgi:hypothetical protein
MLYQVINVQNLLNLKHITTTVRNEFSSGATGDLSANDTWAELWLDDERDEDLAKGLIQKMDEAAKEEWFCSQCGEKNGGSFEICWQCQTEQKAM